MVDTHPDTKIIFPNGTDYLVIHEGIRPVKWEKENWNDWCHRHHNEKYAIDKTDILILFFIYAPI